MLNHVLNDKNIYPDAKVLTQYLGKSINAWDSFIDLLKVNYPLISTEWRYYNDGKSWLFKVTKKAKTVCWVSVWEEYFKVTFYFNNKAKEVIKNSLLDEEIKKRWLHNGKTEKFNPITIEIKKKTDLKIIKMLIELKEIIK
jgi:dTDP-4-dehydrorhamnose reductase